MAEMWRIAAQKELDQTQIRDKRAFEIEPWMYIQYKRFHQLHLLRKVQRDPDLATRPIIPTTEKERLAYYWVYTTSAFKLQIANLQQIDYTGFFWVYIQNVLFKTLPTNYIHMFLATYNSDQHFFASKMFMLSFGISWQVIVCGILQLTASADLLALYLHFAFFGYRNPWSRCHNNFTTVKPIPKPFRCLPLSRFKSFTEILQFAGNESSKSYINRYNCYYSPRNDTLFTVSHLDYFIRKWVKTNVIKYYNSGADSNFIIHFCLIWIVAASFYKQLYKRYPWKIIRRLHHFVIFIYVSTFLYLVWYGFEINVTRNTLWQTITHAEAVKWAKLWDFGFQAEAISGPPVVHILTARTTERVNPARDSALMTASNCFMYFFKGIVNYKLKTYVEHKINAPVFLSILNPYPIFYMWPIFFDTFYLGPVIARIFYIVLALLETMVFIITYQLLVDVIVCEWKWARRWVTTILITVIGIALSLTLSYTTKMFLYIFTTAITSLTETVVICWLYPLSRLMDDIYFHDGTPVRPWRKWSLRILPLYFVYKTYVIFKALTVDLDRFQFAKHQKYTVNADYSPTRWAWMIAVLPLPLGALFAIIKYVVKEKKGLCDLLLPRPDWGARDFLPRQFRKKFSSREYVGSQASRYQSRLLMARASPVTYRLDLCFGDDARRSTVDKRYVGEWAQEEEQ